MGKTFSEWVAYQAHSREQAGRLAQRDDLTSACAVLDAMVAWGDDTVTLTRPQALALIEACEFLFRLQGGVCDSRVRQKPALRVVESVE